MTGLSQQEFERAVVLATEKATQNVAARNRHRLVRDGFLVGLLVASMIAAPILWVTTGEIQAQSKRDSLRNCTLITMVAEQARMHAAHQEHGTIEFERRSRDRFGLTPREFNELVQRSTAYERQEVAALGRIARTNCRSV